MKSFLTLILNSKVNSLFGLNFEDKQKKIFITSVSSEFAILLVFCVY